MPSRYIFRMSKSHNQMSPIALWSFFPAVHRNKWMKPWANHHLSGHKRFQQSPSWINVDEEYFVRAQLALGNINDCTEQITFPNQISIATTTKKQSMIGHPVNISYNINSMWLRLVDYQSSRLEFKRILCAANITLYFLRQQQQQK